ncbi:MAG: hypothetical protein N3F07_04320 [Candidatus Micrarchaeota archaeon]|nr:hypothetical protein [Candidatus Micrarchaeota archaeon]
MLVDEIINRLQIMPLERLKPHEEIIPYNLQKLREAMLNLGRLVDPLIIENKNFIVIDGNHRRKVLEIIKCPNAACQLVDYDSPEIRVGTWFPVSKTIKPDDINVLKGESVDYETGLGAIEKMQAAFLYVKKHNGKKECVLYDSNEQNVQSIIAQQRKFITSLEGRDLQYVADDKAEEYLNSGYAVFYRRRYTKSEIVQEAMAGRVMPPKSTRHIIPDRIIRLNLHLGWLSESPEMAKQLMDDSLRKRLNEGSIRRYVEPVIVLY